MARLPRVFISRELPGDALTGIQGRVELDLWAGAEPPSNRELAARFKDANGVLCLLTDAIDALLLDSAQDLRVISSCSVGVDHIDVVAATARGIPVGHTPGVLTETTADLAFALLLAAARRVAEGDRYIRKGDWRPERVWAPDMFLGRDLHGASLGIVGFGAIGRAVARRARGFGMRVRVWSRTRDPEASVEWGSLDEVLSQSDFLSIHVALSDETRGLIDRRALSLVRPDAVLVNTARGGIVDEAALADALAEGRLAGAGLDVFETEPIARDSPLLGLENVVLTPHVGSASVATRSRMAALAVDNLLAGLEGRRLPHCANPEVYS